MAHRPPSPSARFYAHRSTPNTPQMEQQLPLIEAQHVHHHTDPFDQFHGFSAPSLRTGVAHPRFGVYGFDLSEENISPRMVIPNHITWDAARLQMQSHAEGSAESVAQVRSHQYCCDVDSESNVDVIQQQLEAAKQQWTPSQQYGLAYAPTLPFTRIYPTGPTDPQCCLQGGDHSGSLPPLMSSIVSCHPRTFRVPSDSEPGQTSGNLSSPLYDPFLGDLEAEDETETVLIPSSTLGESRSTIYPEDSVSTASRAGAPPYAHPPKKLVDDAMEIHDICLAATQRHLESLRVNWDLRNGRPMGGGGAGAGEDEHSTGGGPVLGHDYRRGDRLWVSYAGDGSRRRAHSESHLEHMAVGSDREQHQGCGHHYHRHAIVPHKNPIPTCTNSLLHNIHHICGLIWRRAARDREDVLSADAWGCREMSFLTECGETIVLYNAADAERDPQACLSRLIAAGTAICRELGDWEGIRLMEALQVIKDGQVMGISGALR